MDKSRAQCVIGQDDTQHTAHSISVNKSPSLSPSETATCPGFTYCFTPPLCVGEREAPRSRGGNLGGSLLIRSNTGSSRAKYQIWVNLTIMPVIAPYSQAALEVSHKETKAQSTDNCPSESATQHMWDEAAPWCSYEERCQLAL